MKKAELKSLIKEIIKEDNILIPRNLEGRHKQRLRQIYAMLDQEVIEGDLILKNLDIEDLGKVKIVKGNVFIYHCYKLKHLGYLDKVEGDFDCSYNNLTTLEEIGRAHV
jgi:hypothetical protein